MSSLEEPLSFDKLPSMGSLDKRFSSGSCRPRGEDMGMGARWIEGNRCSTSNSCSEDTEDYMGDAFLWGRKSRETHGNPFSWRSLSLGGNHTTYGNHDKCTDVKRSKVIGYFGMLWFLMPALLGDVDLVYDFHLIFVAFKHYWRL